MTQNNPLFTGKKREPYPFLKGWGAIPANAHKPVMSTLTDELGWSTATFYNKLNGQTTMSKNEITFINSVFAGYGIEAATGEWIPESAETI